MILKTIFVSEFKSNICQVVEGSEGALYHSKQLGLLGKVAATAARTRRKTDSDCVCHSMVRDTDGFLKLCFVLPLDLSQITKSASSAGQAAIKDSFWRKPVQFPTLLADLLHDDSLKFNASEILLKRSCPDFLACWPAQPTIDDMNCNSVVFLKGVETTQTSTDDWMRPFVESARAYFGSKHTVLSLTDNLALAFDPWGSLLDVLKDDESLTVELKFPVLTQQLVKDLQKEITWFSYISLAKADEQEAVSQISVKDRAAAAKISNLLKKSMHCTHNTINFKKDFEKPVYTISGSAQTQTWFIRLEFYQKDIRADEFEIWFPHLIAYEHGLEVLSDPQTRSRLNQKGRFQILEEKCVKNIQLANQENQVFWGDQTSTSNLINDPESKSVHLKKDTSFRLVCRYTPKSSHEQEQFISEHFIRDAIGYFLRDSDFLVMIKQTKEEMAPQEVNSTVLRNSFDQKFKEFVMKPNVKYLTFDGFRTPLILLRTSDTKEYRTTFVPCHTYFGEGKMQPDFKYFDGLRDYTTFCYTFLGRTGKSSIPTKACDAFKKLVLECSDSLRISATPDEDSDMTRLEYYFSFNDPAATAANRRLATILCPITQTVSTLGVSLNSSMKRDIDKEIFTPVLQTADDVWEFNEMEGKLTFSIYSCRQWTDLQLSIRDIIKSLEEYFTAKVSKQSRLKLPGMQTMSHISMAAEEPDDELASKPLLKTIPEGQDEGLLNDQKKPPISEFNDKEEGMLDNLDREEPSPDISNSRLASNKGPQGNDESFIGRKNDDSGLSHDWLHLNNRSEISHTLHRGSLLKPFERQLQLTESIKCDRTPNCEPEECPQFQLLMCGHSFCRTALSNNLQLQLDEHHIVPPIYCPARDPTTKKPICDKQILLSELWQLHKEATIWEKVYRHSMQAFLEQNAGGFQECVSADCHNIVRKVDGTQVCEYCNQSVDFANVSRGGFKLGHSFTMSHYGGR